MGLMWVVFVGEDNKEDAAENPDIYQQLSEAHLPHTLAGQDQE